MLVKAKGSTMDNERQVLDNENMSEDEVQRIEDEENENKSSGDEGNNDNPKRKRYHRHTQQQIEAMEAFFKECPHPDTVQRNELSRMTGMEPLQIKFWFQNKRTQMKSKHERQENKHLREENEKLRAENMRIKEALSNACCPACGRMSAMTDHLSLDERQLRMENARLKEEVDRISAMAANYVGKPFTNAGAGPSSSMRKR